MTDVDIRQARTAEDIAIAREMFREYQAWLGVDLCFQDFDSELANLPGAYAPPWGEIFIAAAGDDVAGIVAVRPVDDTAAGNCEVKRLYVRANWRGQGLGRALADAAVSFATHVGYVTMVLDTLPHLDAARAMYTRMGFEQTAPYYENPLPGVVYMKKILNTSGSDQAEP